MSSLYDKLKETDLLNLDPEIFFSIIVKAESTLGAKVAPNDVLAFSDLNEKAIHCGLHPGDVKKQYWQHLLFHVSEFAEELGGCEKITEAHMIAAAKKAKEDVFKNAFEEALVDSGSLPVHETVIEKRIERWAWYPATVISLLLTAALWLYITPYKEKDSTELFLFWPTGLIASILWTAGRLIDPTHRSKIVLEKFVLPLLCFVSLAWGGIYYQHLLPLVNQLPPWTHYLIGTALTPGIVWGTAMAVGFPFTLPNWITSVIIKVSFRVLNLLKN